MVLLENVAVGYNHKKIISDINMEIAPGEIVTLIGPNGSGKSTILKSIIGQLPLLNGSVYVDGKDVAKLKQAELARLISIVMTERVRTELMTCREVVATGRYPYTNCMGILGKEDDEKVAAAIERVRANEVAGSDFMQISDGQRQRVMIARALCQEPKLMVLDEPTSYLDIRYKLSILKTIKELAKKDGITIIMSLHELDMAEKVSDRVVCLKDGRIDKVGTPEEVFEKGYIKKLFDIEDEDW